ncbi:MAG: PAS domain S-box protein, partial [bacterium]|nr:PAS domain S-box protein [bacterium]
MKDHTKSKAELISELQALRKRNHELESQERDENIKESQKKYKALFEESENLAGILRQSTDSIMLCDLDGNIKYVNPMFEKITGYTFEEVKEKKPKILRPDHPPYPKNFYKTMWATLLKGKIWKGEFINKKKNNQTFIEEAAIFPFRELDSGKITGYCAVKKDITNSRNMEEQLKKSYHKMAELKN